MTTHQPPPPPSKPADQPDPTPQPADDVTDQIDELRDSSDWSALHELATDLAHDLVLVKTRLATAYERLDQLTVPPAPQPATADQEWATRVADHARCQREWAAALRWFGQRNRRVENWMSAEHLAERIEDGTLTPWANPVACPNCRGTGAAAHPLVPSRICEDCKGTGTCSPPADTPEPDEPVADVLAAFERGPHGVTAPPPPRVEASGVKLDEPPGQRTAAAAQALDLCAAPVGLNPDPDGDTTGAEHDRRMATGEPVLVVAAEQDVVERLRAELATARGVAAAAGAGWDREATELVHTRAELAETVEANHRWAADHAELTAELDTASSQAASRWQRIIELREELATARRDAELWERAAGDMEARDRHAAADTLDWAAGQWVREVVGVNEFPTPAILRGWAAEIRAGTHPVPGSPEPDGGGDGG
jgi:hypothetical protein